MSQQNFAPTDIVVKGGTIAENSRAAVLWNFCRRRQAALACSRCSMERALDNQFLAGFVGEACHADAGMWMKSRNSPSSGGAPQPDHIPVGWGDVGASL